MRAVGTGFTKDAQGNILPGATDISVWYQPSQSDLSFLTLVSGKLIQVVAAEDVAVLTPGR